MAASAVITVITATMQQMPYRLLRQSLKKKSTEKKEKTFVGKKKLKFSYKEQREYETIESVIADLEEQIQETETKIAAAVSDYVLLQELSNQKDDLEEQLAEKMDRWVYLSDLAERIEKGETV